MLARNPLPVKTLPSFRDFAVRVFSGPSIAPSLVSLLTLAGTFLRGRESLLLRGRLHSTLTRFPGCLYSCVSNDRSARFTESESGNRALRSGSSMTAPSWSVK